MGLSVVIGAHPLLDAGAFVIRTSAPLVELATPPAVLAAREPQASAPFCSSDTIRAEVRALLRHGGFKPAGRSKPASEYLLAAQRDNAFPTINALVDACNVVSLHSGLPISLVDVDKLAGGLAIDVAPPGTTYVFNPSGQVIDAGGLLCLRDELGPSGTPVKDAQRTKTHDGTRAALAIIWGTSALAGLGASATAWFRELVAPLGSLEDVELAPA
ncbi:MAG TPA: phenylalanine--tRNA ligase beta subunit-related protein [Kofleriaceae bacterium]|jgi:DNA/RNA-binding domain of Phe-tRNA-synthetase-like protein